MEISYHIHRNGEQFGPYSEAQVAQMLAGGTLLHDDLAWSEGMTGWQPIASLHAFAPLIHSGASVPELQAAPVPVGSATARYLARQAGRTSGGTPSTCAGFKIGILVTLGCVVAIGLAWFCASWWMGRSAELGLRAWTTTMSEEAGPGIETRIVSFRRGVFSSNCVTRTTIAPGETPVEVGLHHKVVHGPFLLRLGKTRTGTCRIITTLDQQSMSADTRTMIRSAFSNREPLRIATDVDFSGNLALAANVAPFTINLDGAIATFDGLSGTLESQDDGTRWMGECAFGPTELTQPTESMRIHLAKGMGHIKIDEMASGLVLNGGTGVTIPSISFGGAGGGMEFEEVQVTTSARTRAGSQSQETEFSIARISSVGDPLVPVRLEGGLTITGTIEGIDVEALGRLQEAYGALSEIMAEDSSQWSDASSEATVMASFEEAPAVVPQLGALYTAGMDLVRPGLGAEMTLRIGGSSGDVRLSGSIAFGGRVPLKDTRTLREAAEAMQMRAQIDFPKDFITDPELAAMLDGPLEEGYIVDREGTYTTIFTLQDGTLRLNAVEMPLPEELLAAMDEPIDWNAPLEALAVLGGTMGESPDQVYSVTLNARQVHFAAKLYAEDNDGDYPDAIEDLIDEQLIDRTDILEAPAGLDWLPEGAPMFHYRMLGIEDGASQSGDLPFLISVVPIGEEWVVAWNSGSVSAYTAEELAKLAANQREMGESEVAEAIEQMMADVGM